MDRREFLEKLEKLVAMDYLESDDIRLYILLLTNCVGSWNGLIEYGTIKNAFGREFSIGKMEKAFQRLVNHNLIDMTSPIPERTSGDNFILRYVICSEKTN